MNKEQVQRCFEKHRPEDLVMITLNNNRRIMVDDDNRDLITFDHDNELLTYIEPAYVLHEMRNYQPFHATLEQGYDMVEALIFKKP